MTYAFLSSTNIIHDYQICKQELPVEITESVTSLVFVWKCFTQ